MYHKEHLAMTISLRGSSEPVAVRYTLLESGFAHFQKAISYRHFTPTFNRLFLFKRGGARITTLRHEYELHAGPIYLLPMGMGFTTTYEAGSQLYFFHLHARDGLGMQLFQRAQGLLTLEHASELTREIIDYYESPEWTETLRWQFAIMQSLARLCQPYLPTLVPSSGQGKAFQELLALVEEQCSPTLTVQGLAQQLHLSPGALSKRFLRAFGIPLSTFITETLMQRAANLLSDTDSSIQQIAEQLGFQDVAYFHRIFKQQTGSTPTNYRRSVRTARYPSQES